MPPLLPLWLLLLSLSAALVELAVCQPADTSYHLAWSEEFEYVTGTQPSSSIWNWDEGAGGWGNDELEFYTPRLANSYINDSALVIQAKWESYYGSPYTSARLNTQAKVEVYLGYVAARVRISMANGFWPAVWMLGSTSQSLGWPYCGEIDFMEQVNGMSASPNSDDHTQYGTVHYNVAGINGAQPTYNAAQQGNTINTTSPSVLWGDDWHVYAFEWTSTAITFSVDNVTYATVCTTCSTGTNAFNDASNPFFLAVNLAMGGSLSNEVPAESSLPGMLMVDWIRVWQKDDGISYVNSSAANSSSSSSPLAPSNSASSSSSSSLSSPIQPSSSSATSSTTSFLSSLSSPSSSTPQRLPSSSASTYSSSSASASASSSSSSSPTFTLGDWSPPDSSYSLVWHEEFSYTNGTQPSASIFSWETGGNGWGNDELEYYTPRNVNSYVSNDALVVAGLWESYGERSITSARLTTDGKVEVYQGIMAARVRVQGMQNGYWPSVWAMGNKSDTVGWPYCGEIDFMEQVNGMSAPGTPSDGHYQHGSIHYNIGGESTYPNTNAAQQTSVISTNNASMLWGDDWHVYAFQWTATTISFIVDDTTYSSFPISTSDYDAFRDSTNPFYFLIDFAFGGSFPDYTPVQAEFPACMEVDWLRVYQQADGVSYITAPTGSVVSPGSSSTSSALPSAASPSSSSSTPSSSGMTSDFLSPPTTSSTAGATVHTSGARLRVGRGAWQLCVVVIMLIVSTVVLLL